MRRHRVVAADVHRHTVARLERGHRRVAVVGTPGGGYFTVGVRADTGARIGEVAHFNAVAEQLIHLAVELAAVAAVDIGKDGDGSATLCLRGVDNHGLRIDGVEHLFAFGIEPQRRHIDKAALFYPKQRAVKKIFTIS